MSARSEFRRLARAAKRREVAAPKEYHPVREADERVERAADERARKRAPRDPIVDWSVKGLITREQADAAHWYRWVTHASRSTVTAAPLHSSGGGKGEAIPPQEIAMEALEPLRLCERAVPAQTRTRWLDPVVVDYRSAVSVAEQRSRETGRSISDKTAMEFAREALDLLVPALAEWQRIEWQARRAR